VRLEIAEIDFLERTLRAVYRETLAPGGSGNAATDLVEKA
jgi:hypothetical protein